jgi:hypothetical protein
LVLWLLPAPAELQVWPVSLRTVRLVRFPKLQPV